MAWKLCLAKIICRKFGRHQPTPRTTGNALLPVRYHGSKDPIHPAEIGSIGR